jgi:HAUS augmin-like complex subunit 1
MLEQQKELDEVKARVESLEKQLEEFAGLPADKEAARKEVGKLEVELDSLRRKRDALFGDLVGK